MQRIVLQYIHRAINAASTKVKANIMKIGDYITVQVYGAPVRVLVLKIHPFGTVDVQRADGLCFRVTGLSF
jgi:hypothetical protein